MNLFDVRKHTASEANQLLRSERATPNAIVERECEGEKAELPGSFVMLEQVLRVCV